MVQAVYFKKMLKYKLIYLFTDLRFSSHFYSDQTLLTRTLFGYVKTITKIIIN